MDEKHEAESDEDCEVYFLKPVNEYNIVDKIKEANKELFADVNVDVAGNDDNNESAAAVAANRKVTFAPNLEDYEQPTMTTALCTADSTDELVDELELKLKRISLQCTTIVEEEPSAVVTTEPQTVSDDIAVEVEQATVAEENETKETPPVEIEEEISEELIITDMEDEKIPVNIAGAVDVVADNDYDDDDVTPQLQRRLSKQITFDFDLDEDNKSLTNLLPATDDEDEQEDDLTADFDFKRSTIDDGFYGEEHHDQQQQQQPEEDEEDDLSIIVASYIPNDFSFSDEKKNAATVTKTKRSTHFFSAKNFSFRRKLKSPATCSGVLPTPPPKMSYKTCCEYRHSLQEQLPKYTGYLSEYGLSREQLERREMQLERKQRFVLEQTWRANEDELQKMQDNERAFTTWLKNKMRYPINKTRNMFDIKRRRRRSSAAVSASCSSGHQHHWLDMK